MKDHPFLHCARESAARHAPCVEARDLEDRPRYPGFTVPAALLILAWSILPYASAAAGPRPLNEESLCPSPQLSERSGAPGCWARWRLTESEIACVPREVWLARLRREFFPEFCGEWKGRWRTYSVPLDSLEPTAEKSARRVFEVASPPAKTDPESALRRLADSAILRVERLRERADGLLAPEDPLGLLRKLVTGAGQPGGGIALAESLAGYRYFCASGLHLFALTVIWDRAGMAAAEALGIGARIALPAARACAALSWVFAWLIGGARPGMLRPWAAFALREAAARLGFRWRAGVPLAAAALVEAAAAALRGRDWRWHLLMALLIALALPGRARLGAWREAARAALAGLSMWLLIALFQAWSSGWLALSAPLFGAAWAPFCCWVAYPGILLALALDAAGAGDAGMRLATWLGRVSSALLSGGLRASMALPGVWVLPRAPLLWSAISAICILAALRCARTATMRWAGGAVLIVSLLATLAIRLHAAAQAAPAFRALPADRITQLDVSQGDSALVESGRTGRRNVGLIDAGAESAIPDSSWIGILAQRNIRSLDWIALTHLDEDHTGGVRRLARILPIRCVETSSSELAAPRGQRLSQELLSEGIPVYPWGSGCVPYPVLAPPGDSAGTRGPSYRKNNDHMGAVWIPLSGGGFYLSAGDADAADEPRIGRWAAKLGAGERGPHLLKISHHGSRTSSAESFLDEIRPTECWISVGLGNLYGHPSYEVLARLRKRGCPVRRTDLSGRIEFDAPEFKAANDRRPR